jgi:predicted DNA-binding transcriptional regulator AlpA
MRYLNREQLKTEKGIKWSRWTISRKVESGIFPAPIERDGLKFWREPEIDKWIEAGNPDPSK